MNYLAHAYLSFDSSEILVGNMISDFVKGKKKFDYPLPIQHGIMLHRMIDTFTDAHPATKTAITFFKPVVGAYAGAFVDVVYDHFLANDENEFHSNGLADFADRTYSRLNSFNNVLPERFQKMLPYMMDQNWLLNYRTTKGIENSFGGLFRRAKYIEYTEAAFNCFKENYISLNNCYNKFFPDVKAMVQSQRNIITAL
ncbi:acyl carrier protein phosphodiesterase [Panacibacter ginsenosidivorans]|nr:ACP phosphodiesterase [Panacibacter ginsenosidivorans]